MRQIVEEFAAEDRKVNRPITVLLTQNEYESFARTADSNARSLSNHGRWLIQQYLDLHGKP